LVAVDDDAIGRRTFPHLAEDLSDEQ
jgi:hypothetical protein